MNNEEKRESRPRRMHGPNRGLGEKPKNLSGTLKKLLSYLNSFIPFIVIALIFAAASSVFSIIGPNKLSDLTDELSKGLVLDKSKIEVISKDISSSLNENKIKEVTSLILKPNIDENTMYEINSSSNISDEDKLSFQKFMYEMSRCRLSQTCQ